MEAMVKPKGILFWWSQIKVEEKLFLHIDDFPLDIVSVQMYILQPISFSPLHLSMLTHAGKPFLTLLPSFSLHIICIYRAIYHSSI